MGISFSNPYQKSGRSKRLGPLLAGLVLGLLPSASLPAAFEWLERGEEIHYRVAWGLVPAGVGMFRATREGDLITFRAQICSKGLVEAFHPVRDQVWARARVTEDGLDSQIFAQSQIEDGKRKELLSRFLDAKVSVRKKGKEKVVEGPPGLMDPLTIIYAVRRLPLKVGETYRLPLLDGRDVETLVVPVIAREQSEDHGPVLKMYPYTMEEGEREDEKSWTIVLTDDSRRLPVRMNLPLGFGTLRLWMTEVKEPSVGGDPRRMFCDPSVRMPH